MTACRLCGSTSLASVVDLGATPPCERFLTAEQLEEPEVTYPLHLRVCTGCWLAQIPPMITPEDTFTEYAYFSSYSTSWWSTRGSSCTARSTGSGWTTTRSWSRWPATTATCCST